MKDIDYKVDMLFNYMDDIKDLLGDNPNPKIISILDQMKSLIVDIENEIDCQEDSIDDLMSQLNSLEIELGYVGSDSP